MTRAEKDALVLEHIDATLADNQCSRCNAVALHHVDHHAYSYTYCANCQYHVLDCADPNRTREYLLASTDNLDNDDF